MRFGREPSSRKLFSCRISLTVHIILLIFLVFGLYFFEDVENGLFFLFEECFEDLLTFLIQDNDSIVTCVEPGNFECFLFWIRGCITGRDDLKDFA